MRRALFAAVFSMVGPPFSTAVAGNYITVLTPPGKNRHFSNVSIVAGQHETISKPEFETFLKTFDSSLRVDLQDKFQVGEDLRLSYKFIGFMPRGTSGTRELQDRGKNLGTMDVVITVTMFVVEVTYADKNGAELAKIKFQEHEPYSDQNAQKPFKVVESLADRIAKYTSKHFQNKNLRK